MFHTWSITFSKDSFHADASMTVNAAICIEMQRQRCQCCKKAQTVDRQNKGSMLLYLRSRHNEISITEA